MRKNSLIHLFICNYFGKLVTVSAEENSNEVADGAKEKFVATQSAVASTEIDSAEATSEQSADKLSASGKKGGSLIARVKKLLQGGPFCKYTGKMKAVFKALLAKGKGRFSKFYSKKPKTKPAEHDDSD